MLAAAALLLFGGTRVLPRDGPIEMEIAKDVRGSTIGTLLPMLGNAMLTWSNGRTASVALPSYAFLSKNRHATASTPNRMAGDTCTPGGGSTLNIRAAAGM